MAFRIDSNEPQEIKIASEQETRRKLFGLAKGSGCEKDYMVILAKYDKLMRLAKDDKERADIAKLGVFEINRLLGLDQTV
jgi:hypothetical protein